MNGQGAVLKVGPNYFEGLTFLREFNLIEPNC